jgi:Predicted metal-binding protein (DUF2103)
MHQVGGFDTGEREESLSFSFCVPCCKIFRQNPCSAFIYNIMGISIAADILSPVFGSFHSIMGKPGKPQKGRVVWNHSTHIPGLIAILTQLSEYEGIQTITPAVLGSTKSNMHSLNIKVSVPIRGGFKLIARKGKTFQEVFLLTTLSKEQLEEAIAEALE